MNGVKFTLIISFFVTCGSGSNLWAMNKSVKLLGDLAGQVSRINGDQFKELAKYSQLFLSENVDKLACQKNESGFIRINIPISSDVESKFNGIKKIRANDWTPIAGLVINQESIHTHPHYFESCIVKGGYSHELYEFGNKKNEKYDLYRILKSGSSKDFIFVGNAPLQFINNESATQGNIKVFDQKMIHRVITTEPKTLSLNVVFEEEEYASYDVYLTKYGKLNDIKTTRDLISNNKSKQYIKEIVSSLAEFAESSK